jgi:hypothetical protein
MSIRRTKLGRTWVVARLIVGLVASACGEDTSQKGPGQNNGDGDGDGNGGDGDKALPEGNLGAGIAGQTCAAASDTCKGGTCSTELSGGALGRLAAPLPAPNGYCTAACGSDDQCGEGGVCFGALFGNGGECRRKCSAGSDCLEGQECATTNVDLDEVDAGIDLGQFKSPDTCQPLPPVVKLGANVTGKTCTKDDDCGGGTCDDPDAEGGGACTGVCAANADCGEGGVCIPGLYGSSGRCSESCSVDTDCQNDAHGWGCGQSGGVKVCVRKPDPLPAGTLGKACAPETEDTDCLTGTCRERGFSRETYPGGYCISRCSADTDCGSDGVCINGQTCFKKCGATSECRPEYDCKKHPMGMNSSSTVCFPKPVAASDAGT